MAAHFEPVHKTSYRLLYVKASAFSVCSYPLPSSSKVMAERDSVTSIAARLFQMHISVEMYCNTNVHVSILTLLLLLALLLFRNELA